MNIDGLINNIMESYEQHGGINRSGAENFPNRQNVVSVLQDLQSLIFPGFKYEENIETGNLRYVTGLHVNRIIYYVVFCEWLLSLIEIFSRFIYPACISTSFLFVAI